MKRHLFVSPVVVIALALAVAACGGAATTAPVAVTPAPSAVPSSAPAADGTTVTIASFAFAPASLTVPAGATVTWTNADSATHTVKWDDGSPESDALKRGGASYARTFDTPGTFTYVCGIHASMKGAIVVTP